MSEVTATGIGPVPRGASVPKGVTAVGRTQLEAHDVDGVILMKCRGLAKIKPGVRLRCRAVQSLDYDLVADSL